MSNSHHEGLKEPVWEISYIASNDSKLSESLLVWLVQKERLLWNSFSVQILIDAGKYWRGQEWETQLILHLQNVSLTSCQLLFCQLMPYHSKPFADKHAHMYTCSKKRHYSFCGRRGTGRAHCCGEHSFASCFYESHNLIRSFEVSDSFPANFWQSAPQKLAQRLHNISTEPHHLTHLRSLSHILWFGCAGETVWQRTNKSRL